jgi:outer membrane protein
MIEFRPIHPRSLDAAASPGLPRSIQTALLAAAVLLAALLCAPVVVPTATAQTSPSPAEATTPTQVQRSVDRPVTDRAVYSATNSRTTRSSLTSPAVRSTGFAQDTTTISFNEAIRIALDQNTDLKRASNQVRSADASIMAERMDFFPTASISSGGQRSFGRSFSPQEGDVITATNDFLTVDGSSNLMIFNGFEQFASLNQAQSQGKASDFNLGRTRQNVVFQVMNQYLQLVENQEVLRVQREELESRQRQLEQIQEFVDAGSRPVSALYEQQAAVAEQESAILNAERSVQLTKTRLLQVLQLDPMQSYDFQAPTLRDDSLQVEDYNLDQLLARAMDRRLDLRAAEANAEAAESGIRIAKSGYYPTLSASFNYGSSWSSEIPDVQPITDDRLFRVQTLEGEVITERRTIPVGSQTLSFFDKLDQRRGGSFTLSLSYSLFDGLRRNERVEQAQVQARNARYDLQDQRLQVALEVREAYLNYQSARQQLEATSRRLRAARQARQAAQERYNLGAASIVELTQANRNFVEAASQRIRARYNLVFQKKLIDYYVGVLNPQETLFQ